MTETKTNAFDMLIDLEQELVEAFVKRGEDEDFNWYEGIRNFVWLDSDCKEELAFWLNDPEMGEKVVQYLADTIFSKCSQSEVRAQMVYHQQLAMMYELFLRYTKTSEA
jgi:hypothetical protein